MFKHLTYSTNSRKLTLGVVIVFILGFWFQAKNSWNDINKSKFLEPRFSIVIHNFLAFDNVHFNATPYESFNNAPINFVDRDGNVPMSAEEILVAKFGADRRMEYRLLDNLFVQRRFGQYDLDFVHKSFGINDVVDQYLTSAIQEKMMLRLPRHIISQSRGVQQEMQLQYRRGYLEVTRLEGHNAISWRRESTTESLQARAAERYLQQDHLAAELYTYEMRIWRDLTKKYHLFDNVLIPHGIQMNLATAELEHLYNQNSFRHIGHLRMHINSQVYRENQQFVSGHDFLYRQFRQQRITLRGVDNRSVRVPFRSMFEHHQLRP